VKPWLDVDEFATLCRADDLPSLLRAIRLYVGNLIDELDSQSAPEFFDWVSIERGRLREMAHAAHLACSWPGSRWMRAMIAHSLAADASVAGFGGYNGNGKANVFWRNAT
jgi:hypothetical protein